MIDTTFEGVLDERLADSHARPVVSAALTIETLLGCLTMPAGANGMTVGLAFLDLAEQVAQLDGGFGKKTARSVFRATDRLFDGRFRQTCKALDTFDDRIVAERRKSHPQITAAEATALRSKIAGISAMLGC